MPPVSGPIDATCTLPVEDIDRGDRDWHANREAAGDRSR